MGITYGGLVLLLAVYTHAKYYVLSDEFINLINKKQNSWTAGRTFHPDMTKENYRRLTKCVRFRTDYTLKQLRLRKPEPVDIPEVFDVRETWKMCSEVFNSIRDQKECGACWAVATSYMISTRICIETNGTIKVNISAEDGLTCCPPSRCGWKCNGGNPFEMLRFWKARGLVTGGEKYSAHGCKPYWGDILDNTGRTRPCVSHCTNEKHKVSFYDDKIRGKNLYSVFHTSADSVVTLQREIFTRGPTETTMRLYPEFVLYKGYKFERITFLRTNVVTAGGTFKHIIPQVMKGSVHLVVLMGWGVDPDGTPYWLGVNSWGRKWGMNGFFKILRGKNESDIENGISFAGGIVDYPDEHVVSTPKYNFTEIIHHFDDDNNTINDDNDDHDNFTQIDLDYSNSSVQSGLCSNFLMCLLLASFFW